MPFVHGVSVRFKKRVIKQTHLSDLVCLGHLPQLSDMKLDKSSNLLKGFIFGAELKTSLKREVNHFMLVKNVNAQLGKAWS